MTAKTLKLDEIRIDGGTQSRAAVNEEAVADYAEHADELPPLSVFFDGAHYWLADGFHRWHALRRTGRTEAACEVRKGTQTDARMYAVSKQANGAHDDRGMRRTNADKRRCVEMALAMVPEWSDRDIAEHVGVGHAFVSKLRAEVSTVDTCEATPRKRKGRDGKMYPAKPKRGKASRSEPVPSPAGTDRDKAPEADSTSASGAGSTRGGSDNPLKVWLRYATEFADAWDGLLNTERGAFAKATKKQLVELKKELAREIQSAQRVIERVKQQLEST